MSGKKKKKSFKPVTGKLHPKHTWKAPDGFKIVVLDRGAASFNVPVDWIIASMDPHLELHNAEPPNDDARLSVTLWHMPPGIDWTGLPLVPLLLQATADTRENILEKGTVHTPQRSDLEIAWTEHRFLDTVEPREAYTRLALARGFDKHLLITMDFWVDQSDQFRPVWDEVLRSLQMGRVIDDPLRGPTLH